MTCDFGRDAETEPRRNVPRRYPSRADDPSPARRYPLRKPPPERRDFPELTPKTRPLGTRPPTRSLFSPRGLFGHPRHAEPSVLHSHRARTRRRSRGRPPPLVPGRALPPLPRGLPGLPAAARQVPRRQGRSPAAPRSHVQSRSPMPSRSPTTPRSRRSPGAVGFKQSTRWEDWVAREGLASQAGASKHILLP